MTFINMLFRDGRVISLIIGLMLIEGLVIFVWRRRGGGGPALIPYAANLLAGACLLLALRGALRGADPLALTVPLLGALIAHLAELALRWSERSGR